jgi:lauroyl/myristoyl acyltransferase
MRGRMLASLLLHDGFHERLLDLTRWENEEQLLRPLDEGLPVIAVTWHLGPTPCAGVGFVKLGRPVTAIRRQPREEPISPIFETVYTERPQGSPVWAFNRCLLRLRAGGLVCLAGDITSLGDDDPVLSCFGLSFKLKRGMASLAYLSGARIVPFTVGWDADGSLLFSAQPPLESTLRRGGDRRTFEQMALQEFVERMEASIRAHPENLRPEGMQRFLRHDKQLRQLSADTSKPAMTAAYEVQTE